MINDLLFVYGTLLSADNEFAAYLNANATLYSKGYFTGRLFDIGEYPGAIIDNTYNYTITGSIYRLTNPEKALILLDDYEGFGTDQHQPNLFIRQLVSIKTKLGDVECWVYLYNLPVDGLKEIKSGNYLDYLKEI